MKLYRWHIIIVLIAMFFLQGCNKLDLNVEGRIAAPRVNELPLQGTWKVQDYTVLDNAISLKDKNKYIGQTAAFDKSMAVLGTEICNAPEYKIKNVSAEEYFLYKYRVNAAQLGIKEQKVNIVTVSSNQQPFHDFIKLNDSSMLVYENQGFLYLSKVSDKIDSNISLNATDVGISQSTGSSPKSEAVLRSGVFLGLRTSGTASNTGSSYRTLWIASSNREIRPVYEMKQLLVPRRTGFWEIDYWSQKASTALKGTLYAHSVTDDSPDSNKNSDNLLEENGRRDILFVGNDYIGTEYRYMDPVTSKETAKYQVLPIDNIRNGTGINISDIAGDDGLNALVRSSQTYVMSQDKSKSDLLQKEPSEDNFSMTRRNGQWIVTGRLNYMTPASGNTFEDFDVYLLPPQKLISYDELKVPWNYIKQKVPEAVDIFTSPNKDLAVIITRNSIEVYTVENGELSEKPVQSIGLQKGESVVMAEWARGDYMEKWEEVIRSKTDKIVGNIKK
ncbi:MAG: hypothetical protein Q8930_19975 [Bacillota bacterium]|nr:hypothetical protein [Bacillota bacterium]